MLPFQKINFGNIKKTRRKRKRKSTKEVKQERKFNRKKEDEKERKADAIKTRPELSIFLWYSSPFLMGTDEITIELFIENVIALECPLFSAFFN